jgi:hypothetical protein
MKLFKENNLLRSFFSEYIFYFVIILFSAHSANFLENKIFLILTFGLSLIIYLGNYKRLTKPFELLFIIWFLINLLAYISFGNVPNVKLITFFSVTARMLLPLFYLRLFGSNFFFNIEKIIFYLSLISLPIFFYQYTNPDFFYSLSNTLNSITIEEQQESGGWYIGVYMFSGWAPDRNCGFMWEPGAFAFMMLIALIIRLSKNNLAFDFHVFVYIITIITTFSTMGYIVLFFVLIGAFLKTRNVLVLLLVLPLLMLGAYSLYYNTEFLAPKIEKYNEEMDEVNRANELAGGMLRLNRFGILEFAFKESLKWPFGYGILEDTPAYQKFNEIIRGPNTYAQILLRWGWFGIILFFVSVRKFVFKFFSYSDMITKMFLIMAVMLSVFSYSLLNNSLLLAILYSPYLNFRHEK